MKRFKQGQKVRIADPVRVAARFYNPQHAAIIGAGNMMLSRTLLDGDAWVFSVTKDKTRALVVFGAPDSNLGIWLHTDDIEKA